MLITRNIKLRISAKVLKWLSNEKTGIFEMNGEIHNSSLIESLLSSILN